jgi:Tol biopolymer transport system component
MLIVAGLATVAGAHGAAATTPSGLPRIAFVRYDPGIGRPLVYAQRTGSGRPRRLPIGFPGAQSPAWSPDGSLLAFVGGQNVADQSFLSVGVDLYVASSNASAFRRLTHDDAREAAPDWSSDGRRLVFVRGTGLGNRSSLWVVGADGSGRRRLTYGNVDVQPAWSSHGDVIAFVRITARGESGVWLVRPDGTGLRRLPAVAPGLTDPRWSPDGSRLLLTDGKRLFTVRPDGRGRRTIARLTTDARSGVEDPQPDWSQDGRWIAFCQLRPNELQRSDVWIVRADGRGIRRVTRSPGLDTDPSIQ